MNNNSYQFEDTCGEKIVSRRNYFRTLLSYVFLGIFIFLILFVITNWPAFRAIFAYHFQGVGTNVFSVRTDMGGEFTPLQVVSSESAPNSRIAVNLEIPVTTPDNRLIIPDLGLSVPIRDIPFDSAFEDDEKLLNNVIQNTLRDGVVRYPGTAEPGKRGNAFITGHSSYYLWDPGVYKDVFAVLPKIKAGNEIIVYYKQKEYRYRVTSTKEVWPDQVDVLDQTNDYRLTLMTCTPVGTNLRRFIVVSELVSG